jgi:FtsZ-binding cell division protein ZapB
MEMLRILQAQSTNGIQNSAPLPPPPSTNQNVPVLPKPSGPAPVRPGQGNPQYFNQVPRPGTAQSQLTPQVPVNQSAPLPSQLPNNVPSYPNNAPYQPSLNPGVYGQPSQTVYPPAIHGSQLQQSARTATERALDLQEENGDLKATIATLQHELKSQDEKNAELIRLSEKTNRTLAEAQREIEALITSNTQLRKKVTEWEAKYTRQQLQFDREIKFISEELDDLLTREIISPNKQ